MVLSSSWEENTSEQALGRCIIIPRPCVIPWLTTRPDDIILQNEKRKKLLQRKKFFYTLFRTRLLLMLLIFGLMSMRSSLQIIGPVSPVSHLSPAPQCLRASTFSSFSKCFGNRFFGIFCKPYTYSYPFWPLWFLSRKYGRLMAIVIFWKPIMSKIGLKFEITEKGGFQFPRFQIWLDSIEHIPNWRY